MKIRSPWLIKTLAFLGVWILRLWMATIRYQERELGGPTSPVRGGRRKRFIFAFWHEYILIPCIQYQGANARVLVSQHADGELIAQILRYCRLGTIRGSTKRGGVGALRQLVRAGAKGHLALIPDGPRGPRRQVQPGLIYLASRSGLPIVVLGIAYRRPWRLKSWDQFAIPKPWSSAVTVAAPPIYIPRDVDKEQMEEYRRQITDSFVRMCILAEQWVETGRWPGLDPQSAAEVAAWDDTLISSCNGGGPSLSCRLP